MTPANQPMTELKTRIAELEARLGFRMEQMRNNLLALDANLPQDPGLGKKADVIMWEAIQRLERTWGGAAGEQDAARAGGPRYDDICARIFPERAGRNFKIDDPSAFYFS